MNHCVPDWDESGAEIDTVSQSSRRAHPSKHLDNEFSELIWTADGDLVMQVQSGVQTGKNFRSPHFALNNEDHEVQNDGTTWGGGTTDNNRIIKNGTLDSLVISASQNKNGTSTTTAAYTEEEDLISWLQYPDDSLDKNDCSGIFTVTNPHVQVFNKDPVTQTTVCDNGLSPRDIQNKNEESLNMGIVAQSVQQQNQQQHTQLTQTPSKKASPKPTTAPRVVSSSAVGLPPKPQKGLNFSHFSTPAVIAKASLHTLGKCSASITSHLQQQFKKNDPNNRLNVGENSAGSAGTARSAVVHQQQGQSSEGMGSQQSSWPSLRSSASRKEQISGPSSSLAGPETNDQTITSSDGSGNTTEKVKKRTIKAGKRNVEDSTEGQSEDAEGESVDLKKAVPARNNKRSRAAEVHNLSERRRRDRINEKMKALQELIPSSNKTDKASMLDEAIEYLKMLQLQLQMMSMRSGLSLPPTIFPSGMQHLQIPTMPHVGMGMGMGMSLGMGLGMGMGMGLLDMNNGRTVLPLSQPSGGNMSMEMYHAYVLQQQIQQQQQLLHHQMQQQQQQSQTQQLQHQKSSPSAIQQ